LATAFEQGEEGKRGLVINSIWTAHSSMLATDRLLSLAVILVSLDNACMGFTFLDAPRASSRGSLNLASTRKCLASTSNDIDFITARSSLNHLACVEMDIPLKKEGGWDEKKSKALLGSLVGAIVLGYLGDVMFGQGVSFFTSSVGGGAGWKLLGGDGVREVRGGGAAKDGRLERRTKC